MTLARLLRRTVTVTPRTASVTRDRYNNQQVAAGTPVETLGYLEQTAATEVIVDRQTYTSDHLCVLPAATVIDAGDMITVDDIDYEVLGPPARLHNPRTGEVDHVECRLRTTAG